ncbi:MAG: hypothetical protein IKO11_02765 [Lachnospiraceae bacterium]|nr:hypothetical protein [Lachnospiraceae bacterium]
MNAFKADTKQQQMIKEFFREETSYCPTHVLAKAAGIILTSISFILLIIPVLEWEEDMRMIIVYGFTLFAMGIFIYASKYATLNETLTKRVVKISELTKYIPVSRMQLTIFRIRKILKPCAICTAAVIALRCILSYTLHGSLSVWDLVLPVVFMICWPVVNELTRY